MVEEIKKEILEINSGILKDIVLTKEVFKILDKYNNQPDYKSAFDEIFEKSHYKNITMEDMIEFSKKYNLGGE